ncbi:MAG: aspartate carbamoyltransferase regulatory subunit [Anaerotignum sp.]|nr:aspartate carbamoyltransferase regulatory subunit [Anaerotignum sp.]
MMKVGAINNGVVIDHITAGKGMELYHFLNLDHVDAPIALIKNAPSQKMGKKDIIKIDAELDLDLDALGYIDPNVTINVVKEGVRVEKFHPQLPEKLTNIVHCKNPRCITSVEQEIPHIFKLTNRETGEYRCIYCESKAK